VGSRYATITSERFDAVVRPAIQGQGWCLRLNSPAATVGPDLVRLESGEEIAGRCVIDSRGPRHQPSCCGYQKFFGLEVETDGPWPEALPAVMDATVAQTDGFHFLYTLPLAPNRVLVEDTYFSDSAALDRSDSSRQVERHLRERVGGWRVVREEAGVLPMPWAAPEARPHGPLLGGYAGGWIHPATGYSFPVALRLALAVASAPAGDARRAAESLARRLSSRHRFARFLNWLLFELVPPDARWQVFARLYRDLPAGLLARFYAMEFSVADAARVLIGRPPRIHLLRPLRSLWSAQ
jgi:lycopene beta-cyclase